MASWLPGKRHWRLRRKRWEHRISTRDSSGMGPAPPPPAPSSEATVASAIDAGAHLLVAAEVKPWGQTVAWVRDPQGVLIEICTAVGG